METITAPYSQYLDPRIFKLKKGDAYLIRYTPLIYPPQFSTLTNRLIQAMDNYFYLGGERAFVIDAENKNALLVDGKTPSYIEIALKVATYLTVFIPAIVGTFKIILHLACCRNLFVWSLYQPLSERDIMARLDELHSAFSH